MKLFKRIWIILLFAGTLSACVKDYPEEIIVPDEEAGNGQGQFFSTTVSIPMPTRTKATRSNNEFNGTENESMVRGVRIVMYETGSGKVAYSKDLEAFNVWYDSDYDYYCPDTFYGKDVAESDWSDDQVYFITVATDTIVRGNYKMLVLLNPTDRLKAITDLGQPLSALYEPATGKNGEPGYITPEDVTGGDFTPMQEYFNYSDYSNETFPIALEYNNFLMLNSQGLVDVRPGDFYKTMEQAQMHPVYTGVERAVAKVTVGREQRVELLSSAATRAGTNFSFKIYQAPYYNYDSWEYYYYSGYLYLDYMTWGVDITNRTSYWMRELTNKAGNTVIEKRGDQDRNNFYAKDANFSGISGKNKTERQREFNYMAAADVDKWLNNDDDDDTSDPSYFCYVLENTMAAPEQMRDVTTRIVVRAVFGLPRFRSTASSKAGGDLPVGMSFYVYKSGRADNPYNNANNGDPSTFFIIQPYDLQLWASDRTYLPDGKQTMYGEGISAPAGAPADFPDLWENIQAVKARFGNDFDFENPSVESFVEGDLEYHKGGISWYDAPIRHFRDFQESNVMGYGRYGVVRNNIYKIFINYLNNAGSAEFPEPKSEPNEKIKNIDLNFWISSWWDRDISYQFGSDSGS